MLVTSGPLSYPRTFLHEKVLGNKLTTQELVNKRRLSHSYCDQWIKRMAAVSLLDIYLLACTNYASPYKSIQNVEQSEGNSLVRLHINDAKASQQVPFSVGT